MIGGQGLSQANLSQYITITPGASVSVTPSLIVSEIGNSMYKLSPEPLFEAGGSYLVETTKHFLISLSIKDEMGQDVEQMVSRLYFTIELENKDLAIWSDSLIEVPRSAFYGIVEEEIYFKQEFVFDNNLQSNMILRIETDNGSYQFARTGSFTVKKINNIEAIAVKLLGVMIDDVFSELDVFEQKNLNIKDYMKNDQVQSIREQLMADEGFVDYQNLALCAVSDYANSNGIANVQQVRLLSKGKKSDEPAIAKMAYIDISKTQIYIGSDDEDGITISASFRIIIDRSKNTYADIKISVKQFIYIGMGGGGKVNSIKNFNFDIYASVTATTTLEFEIVLTHNGEVYDIKERLQNMISSPSPESYVAEYKRNISLDTQDITIFSVDLFKAKFSFAYIFDIAIPVSFSISININAAFSAEISYTIMRTYGIRGNHSDGVDAYEYDRVIKHRCELYYSGYIGIQAGIGIGLELSVLSMDWLGAVGIEAQVGAYFDFYGFGQTYYYTEKIGDGKDAETTQHTKIQGGNYYEVGIYMKMGVYAKSSIFFLKVEADFFTLKFPLMDGGEQYVGLEFGEDPKAVEYIEIDDKGTGVVGYDLFDIVYMNLKTGKTETRVGDRDNFYFFTSGAFEVDRITGKVTIKGKYSKSRQDGILIIRYVGNVSSIENFIEMKVRLVYLPEGLDLPEGDINTQYTVTFKIAGEVYHTQTVYAGAICYQDYYTADEEYFANHPEYDFVYWKTDLIMNSPVMCDTVHDAVINYKTIYFYYDYPVY